MTTATGIERQVLRAGGQDVPLIAGPGALAELPQALREVGFTGRLWLVADRVAAQGHGRALTAALPEAETLVISGAEGDKSIRQVERVWDWLVDQGAQRRDALVAFGGGVVCDLVGFAAASYLRGIGLVNVPTTLLAQVDASVGGKTGVNHARGKNLIGAFHQPLAVVADTLLLSTLTPRAYANGMAEVAKIAMIADADLFCRLERDVPDLSPTAAAPLTPIIARAIALKAAIVERDEREDGERMLLNYGHTVGHALESAVGYGTLLHGEAVAVGMGAAAAIAHGMGILEPALVERQQALVERMGLPTRWTGVPVGAVLGRLVHDKKRAGSRQKWVLADALGHGQVRDDVSDELVRQAVTQVLV